MTTLLAVPNVSEGRDPEAIAAIAQAFDAQLLDIHSDPDHHRSVFTLAGGPGTLSRHIVTGAREALARINLGDHEGEHPRVGVIDVAPIVYLSDSDRGAACAEALVLADLLAEELELPVFLYGALAHGRTRSELRRGGPQALATRIASGELVPDFGPRAIDPAKGAVLVAARPPLVAFNVELDAPATLERAQAIAASIRETGSDPLIGVRAIGMWLGHRQIAQVSTNVEDTSATKLGDVVEAVRRHASATTAELVGLAPGAAFEGFPDDVGLRGFDPAKHIIENALVNARPEADANLSAGTPPPA